MFDRGTDRTTSQSRGRRADARKRTSPAQIVVIFAAAIIVFVGLCAIVIDVSWYWSSSLRMQRAADAAALAGVVWLPGDPASAITSARAEAAKNGYTNGTGGVTVTPVQDTTNLRRLKVTVSGPVSTYFARVLGITSWNATRSAKADFILPVPMGSPQNYYGLGDFVNMVAPAPTSVNNPFTTPTAYNASTPTTGSNPTAVNSGGGWTNPGNAYASDNSYTTSATNNNASIFKTFSFSGFQSGATIDGVVVNVEAKISAANANCKIKVEVSWNGGTTWGSTAITSNALTTSDAWYLFGSTSNASAWGSNHSTWATSDFTTANNFQVRLTNSKGTGCSGTASVDEITAAVYSHTTTVTTYPAVETTVAVNDPNGNPLTSQGFWGAVITKGGQRGNGDRYSPANDGSGANAEYDSAGYDYTIEVGSSGKVALFDPTFCAAGGSSSGGSLGTGDHWIGTAGTPVTTMFNLYSNNNTPLDTTDDTLVATSGNLFVDEVQADNSGTLGSAVTGYADCSTDIYHDAWWTMASNLAAGTYRLNVNTSSTNNNSTNAENDWSIWVTGSGTAKVYGGGRMVAYNNLASGTQRFYLAQIDKVHAGKTMVIDLFDPGDVGGNASLRILSPDGNAYNYASFTWTADNGSSGSGSTITTASGGTSYFNNSVITISIPLPTTYGSVGLTPSGETQSGWWKIEYNVSGGNDTTTWQVSIRGNPVHLVLP